MKRRWQSWLLPYDTRQVTVLIIFWYQQRPRENSFFLGCDHVFLRWWLPTFRKNVAVPSSWRTRIDVTSCTCLPLKMKALRSGESSGTAVEVSDLNRILPSFILSIFFCFFFPYRLPSHTVFCSHILFLFLFYRLLLSSFSFDFFYFTIFLMQLICLSFVIHWLKYLHLYFSRMIMVHTDWGPPAYSVGTGGAFTGGRAAGTWSWPPTSI